MSHEYDVVGVGICALDLAFEVSRYPGPDEKMRADRFCRQGGGLVATALVTVARLGGRCAYVGRLGDDALSQFVVDEFDAEGVDTRYVQRVKGASVLTAVIVAVPAQESRMIVFSDEANPVPTAEQIPEEAIQKSRVLHVDNFYPEAALRAAEIARAAGVPVTADMEPRGAPAQPFLELCDYVVVPLELAQVLYGEVDMKEAAAALFDEIAPHGGRAAAVTCGSAGAFLVSGSEQVFQPAYKADVVDTTGCGDVFHGAFALGIAEGWPLKKVMAFSAATAALKCRKLGGRAGIPRRQEVEEFLLSAETRP